MGTAGLQGELWGARAKDWTSLQENFMKPIYVAAYRAAGVTKGHQVLDIGCGAGLALVVAGECGAEVSGIDASTALVEVAKSRLPEAQIVSGEMEDLPFPSESFDVVSGFNSFQYAADRLNGLKQARRVTRSGGRIIAAVWGDPERCDMRDYIGGLGKLLPPPPPGAPGPWALSQPGALEDLMTRAEIAPSASETVRAQFDYEDQESALLGLLASGVAVRAIRHSGEDAVRAAIADAIRPYRAAEGKYRMVNEFRFVIGAKD